MEEKIVGSTEDERSENETEPETTEEVAAEEASETPRKHGEIDPSFNCTYCVGEGLLDNGTICSYCHGTGRVA